MYSTPKWEQDAEVIVIEPEKNSLVMQQDFDAILNL